MKELQVQLAWNRLLAIVEEQAQVLMRTAFSTVVREAGDLSAGVFDVEGEMLAQAVTGTPGHVNSMAEAVKKFLAKYPISELEQGDVLLTNDPWDGTGHLNDFTVVTPVFLSSEIIGFLPRLVTLQMWEVGVLVRTRMIYSRKVCESLLVFCWKKESQIKP